MHAARGCSHPSRPSAAPLAPRRPLRATVRVRDGFWRLVQASGGNCPYSTLGVPPNADETDIKQAYRKLVLQYHPDVCQTSGAERKFMSIQQAYELLTGKSRGADGRGGQQRGDWAFHDWYWNFMQKRRWGSYKKGSAAAASQAEHAASSSEGTGTRFHQQPEHKSTIRSQLAGLRHRAAIRANKRQPRWTAAAAADADASAAAAGASYEEEVQEQPEATASLEYDSTEMSDGCNMASGIADWEAAAAAHAAKAAKRRFNASESHKQQVMSQVAGLHRMAAAQDAGGMW